VLAGLTAEERQGLLLKGLGKLDEAEPLLRSAFEGRVATLGEGHPSTLFSMNA